MKTNPDATLEEIWAIRHQITAELGRDPKRLAAHYQRKQKRIGAKLYKPHDKASTGK
jgi:hypothetical protein